MKFYPRVNVTDQDKMSLHLRWKKTKCLCRFLESMTKSQSRISKKDSHMAEGKMPIPKQFQNRNWQAEVRMVCNGEHCLHWLMREVRKVCNGEHCLHWWKLFCLWIYNVQLYFKNNFPFQNPAYEVCSMERWSSKPGKCFNQMECLLWNPIRSSLCTGTSSPTWGCYRSDVLAWVKLQLPMSQGTTRVPLFGIKGRQNGFPC